MAKQSQTAKVMEAAKNAAETKKSPVYLTPMQVVGTFAENLGKADSASLNSLYGQLILEFTGEATSRISIGNTLIGIRTLLGENFVKFLNDAVVKALRKSQRTCYQYIALAQVANLKFAKSRPVRDALFRIWNCEGCFDAVNGELKPAVDDAIKACGGVPENADSQTAEVWARKFVDTVDKLVATARKATPGGRKWDADTIAKKHGLAVKGFASFLKHVSANKAIGLLSSILVEAMVEMSAKDIADAMAQAKTKIAERKLTIKQTSEENAEAPASQPVQ